MTEDMRSRVENILNSMLGTVDPADLLPAQSRVEAILMALDNKIDELGDLAGKLPIHICTSSEYNQLTGIPTIADPEVDIFYLVPDGTSNDLYTEWIYTGDKWEYFGEKSQRAIDAANEARESAATATEAAETAQNVLESIPAEYTELSENVDELKGALVSHIQPVFTIGKDINASGAISNNQHRALSDVIACQGGDIIINSTPAKDANDVYLQTFVATYKTVSKTNDTFVARVQLTTNQVYQFDSDITGFRIAFGRSVASGVVFVESDLDYLAITYLLKGVSIQDWRNFVSGYNIIFSTSYGVAGFYFEYDAATTTTYIKAQGVWYIRGAITQNVDYADVIADKHATSPGGVEDCIALYNGENIVYDTLTRTFRIVNTNGINAVNIIPIFVVGYYAKHGNFGVVSGIGQWIYQAYIENNNNQDTFNRMRYGTSDYSEEVDTIVSKVLADRDINTVTVAVGTDFHNKKTYDASSQIAIFNRIAERCADFSVNLGDTINGRYTTLEENMKFFTSFWANQHATSLPVMFCRGNHEMHGGMMNTDTSSYMNGDNTAIPLEKVLGIPVRKNCFDVDYSTSMGNWRFDYNGVRFIGLDGSYKNNGGFNQEGISFLTDALNDTKPVVIFCHFPANRYLNALDRAIENSDYIENALKNRGNVLAYIHGHTHWDNIYTVDGNGFPYISTCCGLPEQIDLATVACSYGTPINYERTAGTYSEYCFDIYNIHKDTGVVRIFRFGAGDDRSYIPE